MNSSELVIIQLIKSALFGFPLDLQSDVDWDAVFTEAKMQTIVPLVSDVVPAEYSAQWKSTALKEQANFIRIMYEQTKMTQLLKKHHIPFVILKGAAAAVYYSTPMNREMGDVDLLVAPGYFDAAFSLFKENGYEFIHDFGDGRDYKFKKGGVLFELHKRYSDAGYDIEEYLIEGINNAKTVQIYGNSFCALPEPVNGLVLLDHIRHHLYGGIGIRQIIDFMLFVNSFKDESEFENEVLPLFKKARLFTFACVIVKMCKMYFGLPLNVSWCDGADEKTAEQLLSTVMTNGNFGVKNPYVYRPVQSLSMDVKKNGIFKTLQRAGEENCVAFKKHKFLRPFAWIYQLFRYIIKGISALFHGDLKSSDVSIGSQKADFFERLGIQ